MKGSWHAPVSRRLAAPKTCFGSELRRAGRAAQAQRLLWWEQSFAGASTLDLRKPGGVAKIERLLLSLDLSEPVE